MFSLKFPYQIDRLGRTASSATDEHIGEMIELVLFTSPGERVNRPEFGCGVMHHLFSGNSPQLAATLQATMHAALNHELGDVIDVQDLEVTTDDAKLQVELRYIVRATGELQTDTFERRNVQ
jgi:uncharacterized protein